MTWTTEMDERLKADRARNPPLGWKRCAPAGKTARETEARWKFLTIVTDREQIRRKPRDQMERDGLMWMVKHKKLNRVRSEMAMRFRLAYRDAEGVSLKSCIDVTEGGGMAGPGIHQEAAFASVSQAKRELFIMRNVVLRQQADLIAAIDGICGVGHTPRALAGGDGHEAHRIETVLIIALDLLVAHFRAGVQKAA